MRINNNQMILQLFLNINNNKSNTNKAFSALTSPKRTTPK